MKKLKYTQPEIIRYGKKFIRCEIDEDSFQEWPTHFNLKKEWSDMSDFADIYLYNKNKELVFFTSCNIGYQDYEATYKYVKGWDSAYYVREDYLYLLEYRYKKPLYSDDFSLRMIEKYMGLVVDKAFEQEAKKK